MSQKVVKGTVLCLHGFAQNGNVFSVKASGIRKAMKKAGYHTVFIDAPLALTGADLPFEASTYGADGSAADLNFRGWVYTQKEKFDIKPSFETIKNAYAEHGPFIGILGFSQGSGIAGLLLANYNEIVGDEKASEALKFAIFYSGFKFEHESVQKYYETKVSLPTLHLMGELDTLVANERSLAYAEICEDHTVLKHPGGHYCPSTKDLLKSEVAWINSVVDKTRENDKEADKKEETIEDLTAQFDSFGKA